MKTLLAVLIPLTFAASAHAASPVQTLKLDLDGDGKADLVQLTDLGHGKRGLLVIYSKGGKLLLDAIVARFQNECEENGAPVSLQATGPKSFAVLGGKLSDTCGPDLEKVLLSQRGTALAIDAVLEHTWHGSHDGSVGQIDSTLTDLAAEQVTVTDFGTDPAVVRSEALPKGCAVGAADFAKSAMPMCAAQPAYYIRLEIQYGGTVQIGPDVSGIYACKDQQGRPTSRTVIRRRLNNINIYDINGAESEMVADGQEHQFDAVYRNDGKDLLTRETIQSAVNRGVMTSHVNEWMNLDAGDPRKPFFDKLPWHVVDYTLTQLDLEGHKMQLKTKHAVLDDNKNDGTYVTTWDETLTCALAP